MGDSRPLIERTLATAQLSPLDVELINALQEDGRASFADLSRRLSVAPATVRRHTEDLLARRVIQITTVTDPRLLGYETLALLRVGTDGSRPTSDIAAELVDMDEVDYLVVAPADEPLIVEVVCRNLANLHDVLERIRCTPGIQRLEVSPYRELYYQEPRWGSSFEHNGRSGVRPSVDFEIDDIDRLILRVLNEDGRTPFQHIADLAGHSESLIRQRTRRLEEDGLIRIMAIVNPLSLGFQAMAWLGIAIEPSANLRDVAEEISRLSPVTYIAICTGKYDIWAEVACPDLSAYETFREEKLRHIDAIASVEDSLFIELFYRGLRATF